MLAYLLVMGHYYDIMEQDGKIAGKNAIDVLGDNKYHLVVKYDELTGECKFTLEGVENRSDIITGGFSTIDNKNTVTAVFEPFTDPLDAEINSRDKMTRTIGVIAIREAGVTVGFYEDEDDGISWVHKENG